MIQNAHNILDEKLPQDKNEAIKHLINLGLNLEGALIEEEKALITKDAQQFQAAQDKKNRRFVRYDMAAGEFKYRLDEFKGADSNLLDELETIQKRIKSQTQTNIDIMMDLIDKAQADELGIDYADIAKIKEDAKLDAQSNVQANEDKND